MEKCFCKALVRTVLSHTTGTFTIRLMDIDKGVGVFDKKKEFVKVRDAIVASSVIVNYCCDLSFAHELSFPLFVHSISVSMLVRI